ncbi:MAG: XrtA system polysaccharide deacetylase [Myxococcota bacterium]
MLSIDVEDWFHILDLPGTPDLASWSTLPSRVEQNFHRMLSILERTGTRATCFFLGWVAERFPTLVQEAARRGHEVASHGYSHQLVYGMQPEEFLADIRRAKEIIEQAGGVKVRGYRCPGFSVTAETPWFFEKVVEAGYTYDSSVFPGARGHGGLGAAKLEPHLIHTPAGDLVEMPITLSEVFGKRVCFFGGGYLRLFPYPVIQERARAVLREKRPIIFYLHPREIDPEQPRMDMPLLRRFKCYVNLDTTASKLEHIARDFSLTTFDRWIERHQQELT